MHVASTCWDLRIGATCETLSDKTRIPWIIGRIQTMRKGSREREMETGWERHEKDNSIWIIWQIERFLLYKKKKKKIQDMLGFGFPVICVETLGSLDYFPIT